MWHEVKPSDTLAGIAIKHQKSIEDIKQANGFCTGMDLISFTHLKIPLLSSPKSFNRDIDEDSLKRSPNNLANIVEKQNTNNAKDKGDFFSQLDARVAKATEAVENVVQIIS